MKKAINKFLLVFKYLLFFISVSMTLYITLFMYERVDKDIIESYLIFIPYVLLLALFIINIFAEQSNVINHIFYNITCNLCFATTIFVCYRTIFDTNMVLNSIMGYKINFNYFANYIPYMKVMLYILSLANILLMIANKSQVKAKKVKDAI